ncbi:uncharacterized protein TNCV_651091 [Trichonephila clavipes]|nr:uncharacterized protein TNCV_651091 [Trichonephila clavipes]
MELHKLCANHEKLSLDPEQNYNFPILKPDKNSALAESYRPISLLPVLSKLAEKVILARLNDHLERENILIPEQHGFRPRLSTSHQLLRVVEFIKEGNNKDECTATVFLDIQKAFDRTKTLGVSWKPNPDCFLIKVKVCLNSSYTKRDVLSTIAKIFDPVGLMAPVISKAKIFLQRLRRSKLEWNDLLPAEEYREWQQFLVSLENINNIEIPRRILVAFPEVIEIHGFADASERCYGAAVYCKSKNLKSETLVRFITSKSSSAY